jgi:hypothetical protein
VTAILARFIAMWNSEKFNEGCTVDLAQFNIKLERMAIEYICILGIEMDR